jgi:hypothetical protein
MSVRSRNIMFLESRAWPVYGADSPNISQLYRPPGPVTGIAFLYCENIAPSFKTEREFLIEQICIVVIS